MNVAGELLDIARRRPADLDDGRSTPRPSPTTSRPLRGAVGRADQASRCSPRASSGAIDERVRRLNDLGFDVNELELVDDADAADRLRLRTTAWSSPGTTTASCCR